MSYTWNSYANIPYMGVLPCGITNIGGDTQVFTLDQDLFAATNPYLMLNPIAQAMVNRNSATGSPFPTVHIPSQQQIQDEANRLATGIVNNINSSMINQSLNVSTSNLAAQKTKLNNLLANPDLPEADKAEVNRLLDKIQEQERKINELSKKMADMDSGEALKEAQEIEKNIREIVEASNKIKTPEPAKTQNNAGEAEEAQASQSSQSQASQSQASQASQAGQVQKPEKQGGKQNAGKIDKPEEEVQASQKGKITEEHRQIADMFHDAIAGLGTDDEVFNGLFNKGIINKDNIIEVMVAYEQTYGASFMDDFMDDADSGFCCAGGQKVKYGKAISRMLRARAIEAGVYSDCKEDLQAINKEMDSTWYINNDIYENYDNIAAVIAVKDGIDEA